MSPRTAEVYAEICKAAANGETRIAPVVYSYCFGRSATSAAFRMAKANGIIEVAYMSCVGTPVYQAKTR